MDRELVPPQRQLSQSGGRAEGERVKGERQREREREGMNLTPGNRCPINIFP